MSKSSNTWSLLSITFIERFAFYLFNGIFILYLISENRFSNEKALGIFSTFKILIYSLPMIMGIISDFVDRQKVFKIGLILSIIGYAIIPIFSFSYSTLIIAIIILASGVAIVRPNIPVLIGENASQTGNEKRVFRDFLLMGFFISLAAILINGLNNFYSDKDLRIILLVSPVLMLFAFLANHFWTPEINRLKKADRQKLKQNIYSIAALFLIGYSVIVLTNNARPLLSIETESSKLTYQNINNFFSIPLSLVLLALLAIKSIKLRNNNILFTLGIIAIFFASIFLAINFQEISNFSFTADNIILVIALIAVLETIFFPIITMLIYKFSIRLKGFAFGLYYSSVAWISISFSKLDISKIYLLIPILVLSTLGIIIILMRRKIRTSVPNTT